MHCGSGILAAAAANPWQLPEMQRRPTQAWGDPSSDHGERPLGDVWLRRGVGHLLDGFGGHHHGDMLDASRVGVAFAGFGLEALNFAQSALSLALQRDAMSAALGVETVLAIGAIDADPVESVAGLHGVAMMWSAARPASIVSFGRRPEIWEMMLRLRRSLVSSESSGVAGGPGRGLGRDRRRPRR